MGRGHYAKTVPRMEIARYLTLAAPIRKLKRFRLCNQEVANGYVYFTDAAAVKRLNEMLRFHNTGERPVEYIQDKEGNIVRNDSTVTKDTKNIFEYQDCLESVKGPDSAGWYTSRCPVCECKGAQVGEVWDDTHDHFRFREEGAFSCHSGCEGWEVFTWLDAMLAGVEPNFDKKGAPTVVSSDDDFDNWMAKRGEKSE